MRLILYILLFPIVALSQQYAINCPVQFHTIETGIETDTTYEVSVFPSGNCDTYNIEIPSEEIEITSVGAQQLIIKKQRGKVLVRVTNTCDNSSAEKYIIAQPFDNEMFGGTPLSLSGYVVLIGNSISAGATQSSRTNIFPPFYGWTSTYVDSDDWSGYLSNDYGVRVYNMGWGGQTSGQVLSRWGRDALGQTVAVGDGNPNTTIGSVETGLPSLIWLHVGINDINIGTPIPTIKSNIESMVSQANALGVKVMITNIGAVELWPNGSAKYDHIYQINCWLHSQYLQDKYDVIVKNYNQWSRGYDCSDDDIHNEYFTDKVHPSKVGYKYFYESYIISNF